MFATVAVKLMKLDELHREASLCQLLFVCAASHWDTKTRLRFETLFIKATTERSVRAPSAETATVIRAAQVLERGIGEQPFILSADAPRREEGGAERAPRAGSRRRSRSEPASDWEAFWTSSSRLTFRTRSSPSAARRRPALWAGSSGRVRCSSCRPCELRRQREMENRKEFI